MPAKKSGNKLQRRTNFLRIGNELRIVLRADLLLNCFDVGVVRDGQLHEPDKEALQSVHKGGPHFVAVVTVRVTDTDQPEPEVEDNVNESLINVGRLCVFNIVKTNNFNVPDALKKSISLPFDILTDFLTGSPNHTIVSGHFISFSII